MEFSLKALVDGITTDWKEALGGVCERHHKAVNKGVCDAVRAYEGLEMYPPMDQVMNAFAFFGMQDTKVVIIGQDPYFKKGEAMGLCFSVPNGVRVPPSLRNILKEVYGEDGWKGQDGDLTGWARQGVLMLNMGFTCIEGLPGKMLGVWKGFTRDVVGLVSRQVAGRVVFLLWGNEAKALREVIDEERHAVLVHTHPSPLSRKPFVGCGHFVEANRLLEEAGRGRIDWRGTDGAVIYHVK